MLCVSLPYPLEVHAECQQVETIVMCSMRADCASFTLAFSLFLMYRCVPAHTGRRGVYLYLYAFGLFSAVICMYVELACLAFIFSHRELSLYLPIFSTFRRLSLHLHAPASIKSSGAVYFGLLVPRGERVSACIYALRALGVIARVCTYAVLTVCLRASACMED